MAAKRHITEADLTDELFTELANALPSYTSVALAISGGLTTGDWFRLTGIALGLNTVDLIVRIT